MGNKLFSYLLIAASLLFASTSILASNLDMELKSRMDSLKVAFMEHNGEAIKEIMTKDGLIVTPYYKKPLTSEQIAAKFEALDIKKHPSYKIAVMPLGPKTALMTMYTSFEGSFEGDPVSSWLFTSSIWVKEQNIWRLKLLQETMTDGP
ncbi:nuclear transport factor 2 family protein [Microbulbifer variabilis]|uniref:nuclear transport factor 2 family protein n=1 Tax=Microbulbifer variabilis TaxID=266805 RepID=UPI001CFC8A3C|nr:nuclear transport factor 2 family protein [Microbulbifer variabilis]